MSPRRQKNADRRSQLRSEARAWREIASDIACGRWNGRSLCNELSQRGHEYGTPLKERLHEHRLVECPDDWCGRYVWPEGDPAPRVLACLFMALEAEDESHSPTGGVANG